MTITLKDIIDSGTKSIAAAIVYLARATEEDRLPDPYPEVASGSIGGGDDVFDYAENALSGDYGATIYIDSADGRKATKAKGQIVWSDESVVEIELPDIEEAKEAPKAAAVLIENATDYGADAAKVEAFRIELKAALEAAESSEE